jgi:hypothetical protein
MWLHQKEWGHLVPGREEDVVRLMNCLSSLISRRLRDKTIEGRAAWTRLLLSVCDSTEQISVKPLIKYRLNDTTQQVRDELVKTKEFVATIFMSIFEVTRQLPTVGTLMFNPSKFIHSYCVFVNPLAYSMVELYLIYIKIVICIVCCRPQVQVASYARLIFLIKF